MEENTDRELAGQLRELKEQNQERAKEIAVLEERMNTKHAEYATAAERLTGETRSAIDRLRTDMARRDTDMADWKIDMAQRENRQLLATISTVGVAGGLLGLLITAQ